MSNKELTSVIIYFAVVYTDLSVE